jgi:hypothetical protein
MTDEWQMMIRQDSDLCGRSKMMMIVTDDDDDDDDRDG